MTVILLQVLFDCSSLFSGEDYGRKEEYRMGFLSRLFGNNEDREYRQRLEHELDTLKEESRQALAKERQTVQELWAKVDAEKEQKIQLQEEINRLQEEKNKHETELKEELESMRKRVEEHENNYDVVSRVLVMAQKDADEKVREARKEAGRITDEAKMETFIFKQKAETEIQERYENGRKQFAYAKGKLVESMNSINQTHEKLTEVYNELGELLQNMPVKIETLFPNGNFDFMIEEKKAETYVDETIDVEAKTVE